MKTFMRLAMICTCALAFTAQAAPQSVANSFDHAKTGYLLRDVHISLMCEQCHVEGIFKNTPKDCAGCHSLGSRVGATPKPVKHVQTNKACDVCHTSPTSFLVKNFSHAGFSTNCASCHNGQSAGVTSKSNNHFPTSQACEACHINTSTFDSVRMDHTGLTSNCAQCHGGQYPGVVSKTATHIVTLGGCENCHDAHNTNNFTTFQGASFDHTTTTSACATCHNGGTAIGKNTTHIPTTAACDTCHTASNTNNYQTFQGARFDHATTTSTCATCHNGGTATGKSATHIPTSAACDTCHTVSNTNNFQTFQGAKFDHGNATPSVAGICTTCHNGNTATGKPSTHITTTAQCDTCHTTSNTANYTTFQGASFNHATTTPAVAGQCSTCHGGQSSSVTAKPATHVPTTAQCDTCHTASNTANYTSFQGASFNHATTTPAVAGQCSTCHGGTYSGVVTKTATHISTSAQCDACHTASNTANYTTFTGATFNHDATSPAVDGRCSTCHDGIIAKGKSTFHTPTTQQCDSSGCHTKSNTSNYTTFLGALVNHATMQPSVANRCSDCHNGTNALGKHSAHVTTTSQCDTCHTSSNTQNYTTFAGATFNHASATPSVASNCSSCHNGQFASVVKKPTLHIPTSAQCDVCHTSSNTQNYTTFTGAAFDHATATPAVAGICSNCHGGQYTGVMKKPALHIPTSVQCDVCHTSSNTQSYTTFTGGTFDHASATPAVAGICSNCHGGQYPAVLTKPALHMATTSQCDSSGCHSASNTQNYTTFTGATFNHASASPSVTGRCSDCHNGTAATGKPNWHIVTVAQCDSCHTQSNTANYTTFTGASSVDHTAYGVGSCYTGCHNGSNARGLSTGHIPTSTISCDGCHSKYNGTSVTSFANPTMNHISTASLRCDACHNGSYTAQGNNGGALGKMTNHIPTTITGTLDCTTCHAITASSSLGSMDWATESMNHNGAQGGAVGGNGVYCVDCHLKGVTYQGSMDKKSHEGTSKTKDCSKSGCHKPLGSKGTTYVKWK